MNNVIHADFGQDHDNSGYLIGECSDGRKKVTGVYVDDIAAFVEGDVVYMGAKVEQGIDNPVLTTMKEMNEFCIMWLCIFQPEVIIEDKP